MPPNAKSQHTTFSLSRCWRRLGQADRLQEGRGQLCFPLWQPHPQECGCQQCFRHDVHLCHCSSGRLRRCEPPPSRKVLSRVNVLSWTACATVHPACRAFAACPALHINCFVGEAWGPGRLPGIDSVVPLPSRPACAGTAAVRTAFADPVVCICSVTTVASIELSPMHAA